MKDFIYSDIIEPTPYELVEQDMVLYGKDYWESLDNMDFFVRYGITKQFFRENFLFYSSIHIPVEPQKPFTDGTLKNMVEGLRGEAVNHLSSKQVAQEGASSTKKPPKTSLSPVRTSVRNSELNKKDKKDSIPKTSKPERKKRPQKPPKQIKEPDDNAKAKMAFEALKKSILRQVRGKFGRKAIIMAERAMKREIKENGIEWGTKEWTDIVNKYFPGAVLEATVQDGGENNVQQNISSENGDQQVINKNDEDQQIIIGGNGDQQVESAETSGNQEESGNSADAVQSAQKSQGGDNSAQKSGNGLEKQASKKAADLKAEDSKEYINKIKEDTPTQFIERVKSAPAKVPSLQQKEKETEQDKLPEIEQPTGIEVKTQAQKLQEEELKANRLNPDDLAKDSKVEAKVGEKTTGGNQLVEENSPNTEFGSGAIVDIELPVNKTQEEGADADDVKNAIESMPDSDSNVNTSMGEAPEMRMEGDLDPKQNDDTKDLADAEINDGINKATEALNKDFGENLIAPEIEKENLKPEIELSEAKERAAKQQLELKNIPDQVEAAFDKEAKAHLEEKTQADIEKANASREDFDKKAETEKENTQKKIDEETKAAEKQQLEAKKQTENEVSEHKKQWESENQSEMQQFKEQSESEYNKVSKDIDTKVAETNKEAENKYAQAETEAEKEQQKAEQQAKKEKEKAKKKDKGFWSSITSAVSSFFDKIKEGINAIFDGLRKLVKGIIDAAKKAVSALIDLARDAIVGMIKAFGAVLKGLISIALAAFPKLAKKFNALIDKAINKAVDLVNKIAEGLKKAVCALLDLVGKAIDSLLAAYQAIINAILDVLEFIAVGIIKILQGIANLVVAATDMPSYFFGQMSEEILGQDVTQPLPNERPMPNLAPEAAMQQQIETGAAEPADAEFMKKTAYNENDISVQPVVSGLELSPEIMAQMQTMGDGEFEFGESSDEEHNVDAFKQEVAGTREPQGDVSETLPELKTSPVAETQSATQTTQAGDGLVGPFKTPMERAGHLVKSMGAAIKDWFSKNWPKLLIGLIAGITGFILVNILTGGALMAALPLIMQIVSAFFAIQTVFNLLKYLKDYLGFSFPGKIKQGAKSLARFIAILAIELVTALLFGGKAAMKGAKKAVKTVAKKGVKGAVKAGAKAARKGAVNFAKTNLKAIKDLGKVAKNGAKAAMKNGKAVIGGIRKGFGKGAKSFKSLGKKLAKQFRFKKFKIVIKKFRFKLLGKINPWVLLADGELKYVDGDELRKINKSTGRFNVGQSVKYSDDVDGIVIGIQKGSDDSAKKYIQETLRPKSKEELELLYKQYKNMEPEDLKKILDPISRATAENSRLLRKSLEANGVKLKPGDNAHHIVPSTHSYEFAQKARDILNKYNIDINDFKNGVGIPDSIHQGLHTHKYMDKVYDLLKMADKSNDVNKIAATLDYISKKVASGNFP